MNFINVRFVACHLSYVRWWTTENKNMKGYYYEEKGTRFPMIHLEAKAGEFMEVLDNLVNYDDGQGRHYDILDEELE